ncbi:lipoyl synthase, partial [Colwellia sp. BRX10-4]|nr:lipoyl synthase [Colwellia sp. BRX10-4]
MSNIKQSLLVAGEKLRDADKLAFIPVKIIASEKETTLKKPSWLKIKIPSNTAKVTEIKQAMRKHNLNSVCEEASCPNLHECFNHGTATFMILGAICTRRCPFCDVAHG